MANLTQEQVATAIGAQALEIMSLRVELEQAKKRIQELEDKYESKQEEPK